MVKKVTLRDRVAQAYHDYGRVCSAHPIACLIVSILTMFVLSYPAFVRFRLPVSSPIDVHWSSEPSLQNSESAPEWLHAPPAAFLQQIIVRGSVEPWNSMNLTAEQAVRGPLSRSFLIRDLLQSNPAIDSSCFHISRPEGNSYLPHKGCLILSPTLFWESFAQFKLEKDVLHTIFAPTCTPSMCVRDILLGMPTGLTGIKPTFQTNRKRSIDYSVTLFLAEYKASTRTALKTELNKTNLFTLEVSRESDEDTFVHVFYRPRKYFVDYFPITMTYFIFMIYLYYSASKFEMVTSKWGLALAAGFHVAATLLMTTGICAHVDMMPTLWGAEIFPYIAFILCLENTLCITRSVVSTPPSLDVSSRVAYGLSQEGYSLCKYFVLELIFLAVGYSTRMAEIQEFCFYAAIGLVIDFYMQLFFYAPCLTFDLQRLNKQDKERFSLMLFSSDVPLLKTYPVVSCPFRRIWPRLFEMKRLRKRTFSDSQLDEPIITNERKFRGFRRSNSVSKTIESSQDGVDLISKGATSLRLRFISFVTRTRIMQRSLMIAFVIWTAWLAFVVHSNRSSGKIGISNRVLETAPQAWGEWQRRTFKWWPTMFNEYNISLSGHYITFLPPIVLSTKINPNEDVLRYNEEIILDRSQPSMESRFSTKEPPSNLQSQIYWLETQLKVYMASFFILLVLSVTSFVLYACVWSKWRDVWFKPISEQNNKTDTSKNSLRDYIHAHFQGHRFPIECVQVIPNKLILSSCQEGNLCLWNSETGERVLKMNRLRIPTNPSDPPPPIPPRIWSIATISENVVALGCADGSIEIACLSRNKLIGVYLKSLMGVSQIEAHNNEIIAARIDGTIDFINLKLTGEKPIRVSSIALRNTEKMHKTPIRKMCLHKDLLITTGTDPTIKVYHTASSSIKFILNAHHSTVCSLEIDTDLNILYSACEEGIVCWWNLSTGLLIKSADSNCRDSILLSVAQSCLLGFSTDGVIRMWSKENGQLMNKLRSFNALTIDSLGLAAVNERLAVTFNRMTISFWDISERILITQVNINERIQSLYRFDDSSVLCQCGTSFYRIVLPEIRLD
ncbi:unnamed protein product [Auanema sp. JU1783]|nr:unnamed protein product [Auanema sp. JU1783]